jgi:hypothetical protein
MMAVVTMVNMLLLLLLLMFLSVWVIIRRWWSIRGTCRR